MEAWLLLRQLLLAATGVGATLAIHFAALAWLLRHTVLAARLRGAFVLLFAHLLEIGVYAALYRAGIAWELGQFRGAFTPTAGDFFYYSATTYTTVGFGDVTPPPDLRIVTAVESLNGIVMVGITTSAMLVALMRAVRERIGAPADASDQGLDQHEQPRDQQQREHDAGDRATGHRAAE